MPLVIRNLIKESDDRKRHERPLEKMDRVVVHRISLAKDDGAGLYDNVEPIPDADLGGVTLASRFHDKRKYRPGAYTGGENPYALLFRVDGLVHQITEIGDWGPHARRWNVQGLGIAAVGDFRYHNLTPMQWNALVEFCALMTAWGAPPYGHTELEGGSKDEGKRCPGPLLDMHKLRHESALHFYAGMGIDEAELFMIKKLKIVF